MSRLWLTNWQTWQSKTVSCWAESAIVNHIKETKETLPFLNSSSSFWRSFFVQILQIKSSLFILEYSFYNKNLRWSSYHFFCNFCCWHLFSNHCSRYQFGKFCSRQLFCMLIFWTALAKLAFQTTFLQRWLKGKCDQGGRLTGSKRVKG